jgi:hypothetical protein
MRLTWQSGRVVPTHPSQESGWPAHRRGHAHVSECVEKGLSLAVRARANSSGLGRCGVGGKAVGNRPSPSHLTHISPAGRPDRRLKIIRFSGYLYHITSLPTTQLARRA